MSKRKIGAGGYVESSEDSDVEAPPQTVPKKRYKPPMISTTKKTMASFLLPKPSTPAPSSRGSLTPAPVASSSKQLNPTPRPVPATSHMPTPKDTPALHKDLSLSVVSDSDPEKDSPTSPIASIGHQTVAQADMPSIPLDTVRARSNVQLERSIHELGANPRPPNHRPTGDRTASRRSTSTGSRNGSSPYWPHFLPSKPSGDR